MKKEEVFKSDIECIFGLEIRARFSVQEVGKKPIDGLLHGSNGGCRNHVELLDDIDGAIGNSFRIEENRVTATIGRKMPHVLSISCVLAEENGYASRNQAIKHTLPCGTITSWLQAENRIQKSLSKDLWASLTINNIAAKKRTETRRIRALGHQLAS